MKKNDNPRNKVLYLSSPIYDLDDAAVYKAHELLGDNGAYSRLYDQMYLLGVPMKDMRTASLLNNCAANGLESLRKLEPELYDKMINLESVDFLRKYGNEMIHNQQKPDWISWKLYCIYLVNKLDETVYKEIFKQKIVNHMLAWQYSKYTVSKITAQCVTILSDMDDDLLKLINEEPWSKSDFSLHDTGKKNKIKMSLSRLPDQSVEEEVGILIEKMLSGEIDNGIERMQELYERSVTLQGIIKPFMEDLDDVLTVNVIKLRYRILHENLTSTMNWKLLARCVMQNDYNMLFAGDQYSFNVEKMLHDYKKIEKEKNNPNQ